MYSNRCQVLAAFNACLLKTSFGILLGFATIALPNLELSLTQQSWFASLDFFSLTLIAPIGGMISGWFGRKILFIIVPPLASLGWILIGISSSKLTLFSGRLLTCVTIALLNNTPLVYVSEIAHPEIRPVLSSIVGQSWGLGTSFAWILSYFCDWRTIAYLSTIPLMVSMITSLFLPESPYWLVEVGKVEKALESLQFFRGSQHDISEEFTEMNQATKTKKDKTKIQLTIPTFWKPFSCIGVIFTLNTLSGFLALTNYLYDILEESGSTFETTMVVMVIGILRLPLMVVAPTFAMKLNPQIAFVLGLTIKALATLSMATYFHLYKTNPDQYQSFSWIPISMFFIEYVARSTLIENVFHMLLGELFATEIRTLAVGITTSVVFLVGGLIIKFYPDMKALMGMDGLCYFYFGTIIVNIIWGYLSIPDNRSKSLANIETSYSKSSDGEKASIKKPLINKT